MKYPFNNIKQNEKKIELFLSFIKKSNYSKNIDEKLKTKIFFIGKENAKILNQQLKFDNWFKNYYFRLYIYSLIAQQVYQNFFCACIAGIYFLLVQQKSDTYRSKHIVHLPPEKKFLVHHSCMLGRKNKIKKIIHY